MIVTFSISAPRVTTMFVRFAATDWQALHRSQLVPSAVDLAEGHLHVLFEGSQRAVDAQALALGGDDDVPEPWEWLRALQAELPGRAPWTGEDALLVRPGTRVAYVTQLREPAWSPLAERVVEAMCSPT